MAKLTVLGDSIVVTSSLKMKDLKMSEKFRPETLILSEKDRNDRWIEMFRVKTTSDPAISGSITDCGAIFNNETHDDNGFATLTLPCVAHGTSEEVKDSILEHFSRALARLNRIELQIAESLEGVRQEKAELEGSITIL